MSRHTRSPFRPIALLLGAAISLSTIVPAVALGASGSASRAAAAAAAAGPYRMNVAESVDWVQQTNFVQCVGTSVQMMLNMQRDGADRTAATQFELQELARTYSGRRPDGLDRKGASVRGWAAALTLQGGGAYRLVGLESLDAALAAAATAIRETGRPVGLLVWRGRHAWVMSGFEATADPALTDDFTVTKVAILDPLYPYGSRTWGPSPKPGSWISAAAVGKQFVQRNGSSSNPYNQLYPTSTLRGKWVLVLPYEPSRDSTGPVRHV